MHRAEKSSQTSCNQQISGIGAAIAPTSSESPIEHAWRKTPRETVHSRESQSEYLQTKLIFLFPKKCPPSRLCSLRPARQKLCIRRKTVFCRSRRRSSKKANVKLQPPCFLSQEQQNTAIPMRMPLLIHRGVRRGIHKRRQIQTMGYAPRPQSIREL